MLAIPYSSNWDWPPLAASSTAVLVFAGNLLGKRHQRPEQGKQDERSAIRPPHASPAGITHARTALNTRTH